MSHAAPRPNAAVCAAEEYSWIGPATVAAGGSLDTGIALADQIGTTISVSAADLSLAPVDSAGVTLSVAGTVVVAGVTLTGGDIVISNGGTDAVQAQSVGITVNRCHQVESEAAPVPGGSGSSVRSSGSGTGSVSVLPTTGAASGRIALTALITLVLGSALVRVSRRRRLPA